MPLISLRRHVWWMLLLGCIGFVIWTDFARIRRIEYVTNVGRATPAPDFPAARDFRYLIVPEHLSRSYPWISDTQEMLEHGNWRIRHTDRENAPFGREVHSASPYRWWLGAIALTVHHVTGQPLGAAVEQAALLADPALHILLLILTALFVARLFGAAAAAISVLSLTFLFPLGAGFLPGVPEDFSLLLFLTPWSVLPLLVACLRPERTTTVQHAPTRSRDPARWFFLAGVVGGIGLWLSVSVQVPVLVGIGCGALLAALIGRRNPAAAIAPEAWRSWGLGGATVVLLAYLIEYAPSHWGSWELRAIHPLYALAWLGAAEVLTRLIAWIQLGNRPRALRDWTALGLGLAAAASVPVLMWRTGNLGFINVDLLAFRLTKQTGGIHAPNLLDWLAREGVAGSVLGTLAPLALLGLAAWLAFRRTTPATVSVALALCTGSIGVALLFAGFQLRWWQTVEALALPVFIATLAVFAATPRPGIVRGAWFSGFALCLLLGLAQLIPLNELRGKNVLTVAEVEGLVERDLAHSLARRVASGRDAIVLAPPGVTSALNYYAGLRGLSSLSWENKEGLSVALRIVISTSREEAHSLVLNRGVTHIVVPTWDPFFDTFIRAASVQNGELLFTSLRRWVIPMWLRPVPHELPRIGGFEDQTLSVFEVVEEQDPAVGMSRVADYFIEMGQLDAAKAAGEALRRYPADFSALVAQAGLEIALNDAQAFSGTLETIVQRLARRADRLLPWDRRLSLAVVLARGKRPDLARSQLERCVRDATEERIRSLSTQSLFHLLYLAQALEVEFPTARPRELALQLLPAESRARL